MKKSYLTMISWVLLVLLVISPITYSQPYNSSTSIKGTITIKPDETNINLLIHKQLPPNFNLTSLEGNITFNYDPETGHAVLQGGITGESPDLEGANIQGTLSLEGSSTVDNNIVNTNMHTEFRLNGEATNGSNHTLINISYEKNQNQTLNLDQKTSEGAQTTHLELMLQFSNETTTQELDATIDYNSTSQGNENQTTSRGRITGPIIYAQDEYKIGVDLDIEYTYTLYHFNNTLQLEATVNLAFQDYMTAYNTYMMIQAFLQYFNTSANISVEPPTQINPVVVVQIEYTGTLTDLESIPGTGFPQMPGTPIGQMPISMQPSDITGIMPTIMPAEIPSGNITYNLDVNMIIDDGELAIAINGEANIPPESITSEYLLNNAQITIEYYNDTNVIEIEVTADATTPEPFTPFALVKEALKTIQENASELQSLEITLTGENGVKFLFNGEEKTMVIIDKTTIMNIDTLAIVYNGTVYYGFDSPMNLLEENVQTMLSPYTNKIILNSTMTAHVKLPFAQAKLNQPLIIEVDSAEGKLANITILEGAYIEGTLDIAYHSPDAVDIPTELHVQPAGKALTIHNVTGNAKIMIKTEGSGQLALLVIHDDGTTELLTDITVENGYIIVQVSTHSTFIPVKLATPSENTTTTTTTSTGTTQETTTTTGETTTSPKTTTTSPGTTTSPSTSPGETTTSGTTAPTTSSESTSEETGGAPIGLIAGIVIVIIVIALAVLKYMK